MVSPVETASATKQHATKRSSTRIASGSLPLVLLALAVLAYATYFSALTINRYNAFESRALDMGNLNQAIWNTAHGNWFHLTNQPGTVNRLSLHVEPIIVPLAALYRLWPDPRLLLLIQATVIALGAIPAFALGRWKLRSEWTALVFALAFLLHPSIQAANWLEFHPVALAPTFLMAAFYFLATKRNGWFALFAVLAASCKEEIALLVFMMGAYAFFVWRRRTLGTATMTLALGWALLAVLGIQNTFADGNIHWERYGYLGETPGGIVLAMLTQPGLVWAQLQQAQAIRYLFMLMLPVAFTSLLGLDLFLLALPSLGINLLAAFPPMHQVDTLIYAAPIVPFVIISGIYGTARLETRLAAYTWFGRAGRPGRWHAALSLVVLTGALTAQLLYGYLPGSGNHIQFTVSEHDRRAAAVIAQIPPEAKVSAQDKLNPHVSGRETVYIFPRVEDADTVFVDVTGPAWPQHPNDVQATVSQLLADGWGLAAADHGYLLLRRNAPATTPPASVYPEPFYEVWQRPPPNTMVQDDIRFQEPITLHGHTVTTDEHGELVTTLYFQAEEPLSTEVGYYIAYLDDTGVPIHDSVFYPPVASLWYPTPLWTPNEVVAVATLPWTLEADAFTLAVGLYDAGGTWADGPRIPIRDAGERPTFEAGTLVRLGGYQRSDGNTWTRRDMTEMESLTRLDVAFGQTIRIAGVDLPGEGQTGAPLPFTLVWEATATPTQDFSVFAHLLDANGAKVAQIDWQPHDPLGPRPMRTWRPGETIIDTQELAVPPDVPAGDYRLIVGVYDWQSGERLPVTGAEAAQDNVVDVGIVRIAE